MSTKDRGLKDKGHCEYDFSGMGNKEEWGTEGADQSVLFVGSVNHGTEWEQ